MGPGIALRVVDTRTGEARTIRVLEGERGRSVSIGAHASCNVVLAQEGIVAAAHAYFYRVSYHQYVEGQVRAGEREPPPGVPLRVDGQPFEIGPFRLQHVGRDEHEAEEGDVEGDDGIVRIRAGATHTTESPREASQRLCDEESRRAREARTRAVQPGHDLAADREVAAIMAEREKRVEAGAPCQGCRSDDVRAAACARCGAPRWTLAHEPACKLHPSSVTSAIARCARCGLVV